MKSIKLLAAVVTGSLLLAISPWNTTRAQQPQEPWSKRLEIVPISVPLSERLGEDDGAVLVVHFSGEIHGGLEPCG